MPANDIWKYSSALLLCLGVGCGLCSTFLSTGLGSGSHLQKSPVLVLAQHSLVRGRRGWWCLPALLVWPHLSHCCPIHTSRVQKCEECKCPEGLLTRSPLGCPLSSIQQGNHVCKRQKSKNEIAERNQYMGSR